MVVNLRACWRSLLRALARLAILASVSTAAAQDPFPPLWREAGSCAPRDHTPRTIRCNVVDVDLKRLQAETKALSVLLPDMGVQRLTRRRSATAAQGFVWEGTGPAGWRATFSVVGKAIVGEVFARGGRIFRLRLAATGRYVVEEMDMSKFDSEAPAPPPAPTPTPEPSHPQCTSDLENRIDVLVLFTPQAKAASITEANLRTEVNLAVQDTNWALTDSGVGVQINLVEAKEVNYAEPQPQNNQVILGRLTDPGPGMVDAVSLDNVTRPGGLRDAFGADIVVLVVDPLDATGTSNPMISTNYAPTFEAKAFAVVPQGGLAGVGNYTFAHELGHVMGSGHQSVQGVFPFSRAHSDPAATASCPNGWTTLMAARTECPGCVRQPIWSNLVYNPCGPAAGISNQRDNARSLNETRNLVSKFRCGTPPPNNVWMRDTWGDTGAEPDPAQAGAAMWQSPYIWARNAQDTGFKYEHQHENPISGQTSWVYVKVHNSGPDSSGALELYRADASTGLSWPTGWTLISSQAIPAFPGNSTKIVEFTWSNLPGLGHHCLLARWTSSDDPMTKIEGPDVASNVRGNNNIVWRNLNIVGLADQASPSADLTVGNPNDLQATFNIEVRAPANLEGKSFLHFGTIKLKLDRVTEKSGKPVGPRHRGVKVSGKSLLVSDAKGGGVARPTSRWSPGKPPSDIPAAGQQALPGGHLQGRRRANPTCGGQASRCGGSELRTAHWPSIVRTKVLPRAV